MPKKILIIDDEEDVAAMAKLRLQASGFSCFEAYTAQEGLKMAEEEAPDLILLDILLPDSHGVEVCRRLKSNPKTREIAIIIFSASNLKEMVEKAIEAGAVDYIIKPFEPSELLEKIDKALDLTK
ncbi:MAG: response regulator [Candidatus Omnitrophica bacterium]|nr:response regulator [Candidatus Omnitrophota bacterium]